ncbi:hypothetical protein [Sporohalobacter salinus]|nr:hypothetical protein [Sporohalobacter salinus]MBM7624543.1 hypothetical protein [Sporohalobacter salinus]
MELKKMFLILVCFCLVFVNIDIDFCDGGSATSPSYHQEYLSSNTLL